MADQIIDGSITSSKIANNAITASKLDPISIGFINVKAMGVIGGGSVDDTVALQAAINWGVTNNKLIFVPADTYKVSSGKMRSSTSLEWWCLRLPTNANIYFEPGAKLVLANNPPSDTRVLSINNVQNVTVSGYVEIDGSASTVTSANDQLHGIFIYNAQNVILESAYVHDCYGDNIFVGGLENTPSVNVKIGFCRCVTAGRKNFVIHYVDQLHVNTAILDNSKGGAPSFTGANSLDLEPDDYTGARSFYQHFDYLSTTGYGNDLSAGISDDLAKKWTLAIDSFDMRVSGTSAPALLSYGLTMKIDNLTIKSLDHKATLGIQTLYAQFIAIGRATIEGINGQAIYAASSSQYKPRLHIDSLKLDGTNAANSSGVRIDGGDLYVGDMDCINLAGNSLYVFATMNNTLVSVNNLVVRNCGLDQVALLSSYSDFKPNIHLSNIAIFDERAVKVKRVLEFSTNAALLGTTIGTIYNPYAISEWYSTYNNFKRTLKLSGGTVLPALFIVEGSPEGILIAPIGSVAMRVDGASKTALYVKETGTGNTGWIGK
jgi:hypothetical protein